MTAKDFVHKWLNQHRGFDFTEATSDEQAHFEQILTDVCEAYLENERKEIVNQQLENDIKIMSGFFPSFSDAPENIAEKMRKYKIK